MCYKLRVFHEHTDNIKFLIMPEPLQIFRFEIMSPYSFRTCFFLNTRNACMCILYIIDRIFRGSFLRQFYVKIKRSI